MTTIKVTWRIRPDSSTEPPETVSTLKAARDEAERRMIEHADLVWGHVLQTDEQAQGVHVKYYRTRRAMQSLSERRFARLVRLLSPGNGAQPLGVIMMTTLSN